jgi:hypothetical protein
MNVRATSKKAFKNLSSFSLQIILMLAIVGSSWAARVIEHSKSNNAAVVTEQSMDTALSQECIPSTSLTDFLFSQSEDSSLFSEFSIDLSTQEFSNCIAFFVNGYTRNPFYTFISTKAP